MSANERPEGEPSPPPDPRPASSSVSIGDEEDIHQTDGRVVQGEKDHLGLPLDCLAERGVENDSEGKESEPTHGEAKGDKGTKVDPVEPDGGAVGDPHRTRDVGNRSRGASNDSDATVEGPWTIWLQERALHCLTGPICRWRYVRLTRDRGRRRMLSEALNVANALPDEGAPEEDLADEALNVANALPDEGAPEEDLADEAMADEHDVRAAERAPIVVAMAMDQDLVNHAGDVPAEEADAFVSWLYAKLI